MRTMSRLSRKQRGGRGCPMALKWRRASVRACAAEAGTASVHRCCTTKVIERKGQGSTEDLRSITESG